MARSSTRSILLGLSVGVVLASTAPPLTAATIEIDRCSTNQNGTYKPILTARHDGKKFIFRVGENGLTNGIAFNRSRTIAWIKQALRLPDTRATYSVCGDKNYLRNTEGSNN